MEGKDFELIQLELKYCERCGSLWLRVQGTDEVYCPSCAPEVMGIPAPRRWTRKRMPSNHRTESKSGNPGLVLICTERGEA
jgi:uncharacterized Zn finger protein (UPF0148 family)